MYKPYENWEKERLQPKKIRQESRLERFELAVKQNNTQGIKEIFNAATLDEREIMVKGYIMIYGTPTKLWQIIADNDLARSLEAYGKKYSQAVLSKFFLFACGTEIPISDNVANIFQDQKPSRALELTNKTIMEAAKSVQI